MATQPQINYAKTLLKRHNVNPDDYLLTEDVPHALISPLIDQLKKGVVMSMDEWNKKVEDAKTTNATTFHAEPDIPEGAEVPMAEDTVYGPGSFFRELNQIQSLALRSFVKMVLEKAPGYFYTVPASSTGKYHPSYCLGNGGLVRHVKAAVHIATELLSNPGLWSFNQDEKDIIIGALLIHDCCKSGLTKQEYTVTEHPLLVRKLVTDDMTTGMPDRQQAMVLLMLDAVEKHMGPWTEDRFGKKVLEAPKSELEKFVHLCDYVASRKSIEIKI